MLLAVLADIHANLEALEAVLADLDTFAPAAVVSLGDNIGYGPDPVAVLERLEARGIPSVRGNHEWAVADPARERGFNPQAREAVVRTRSCCPRRCWPAWPPTRRRCAFSAAGSCTGCRPTTPPRICSRPGT